MERDVIFHLSHRFPLLKARGDYFSFHRRQEWLLSTIHTAARSSSIVEGHYEARASFEHVISASFPGQRSNNHNDNTDWVYDSILGCSKHVTSLSATLEIQLK